MVGVMTFANDFVVAEKTCTGKIEGAVIRLFSCISTCEAYGVTPQVATTAGSAFHIPF